MSNTRQPDWAVIMGWTKPARKQPESQTQSQPTVEEPIKSVAVAIPQVRNVRKEKK